MSFARLAARAAAEGCSPERWLTTHTGAAGNTSGGTAGATGSSPRSGATGTIHLMGAINIIVTVLNMRATGMTLMRMPLFCWT